MCPTVSSPSKPLSTLLIGTWELLSRIDRTAAGERRVEPSLGDDPIALLSYDRTGHFAAQFMKRDRTTDSAAASTAGRRRRISWSTEQQPRAGRVRRILRHVLGRRRPRDRDAAAHRCALGRECRTSPHARDDRRRRHVDDRARDSRGRRRAGHANPRLAPRAGCLTYLPRYSETAHDVTPSARELRAIS